MTVPLALPGPMEVVVVLFWLAAFLVFGLVVRQYLRAREQERNRD